MPYKDKQVALAYKRRHYQIKKEEERDDLIALLEERLKLCAKWCTTNYTSLVEAAYIPNQSLRNISSIIAEIEMMIKTSLLMWIPKEERDYFREFSVEKLDEEVMNRLSTSDYH
ncbi:hypothetical protein BDV59DRAFT_189921 [Aspergillus ambiguus]|uniref:uncharacterized protein n=1 Tax=Aspergillus ambiguus TaxID=176160 RepID=UPI003CCD3F2B